MLLKLGIFAMVASAFLFQLRDMTGLNRLMFDEETRTANDATLQARNMAQYHSLSLAFSRDNASHTGVIPDDASGLQPYINAIGYSAIGSWESNVTATGCVITYPTDTGTVASNNVLGNALFQISENPYAGVTTDTGITNSKFTSTVTTGIAADRAIIASCSG